MRLVPVQRDGAIAEEVGAIAAIAAEVKAAAAQLYETAGYEPPWICYLAITNDRVVGTCGFKGPPGKGRVEIAYFTFPGYEGKGIATQMARQLLLLARNADPGVVVAAQTLPVRNASHRILEKLGFACIGPLEHPQDGTVLEWQQRLNAKRN